MNDDWWTTLIGLIIGFGIAVAGAFITAAFLYGCTEGMIQGFKR